MLKSLYELMNIKWMCFQRFVFQCVWGNEWVARRSVRCRGRACTTASSRAASFAHRYFFISLHFYFSDKNSVYYRVVSGYSALLDHREDICAAGLSVLVENGEMGSRVSAADGDFQRIVDRSGRAHIPTALHVRKHFHSITRKKTFPQHYT